jgi:predicted transcriptional regulator
MNKRPTIKEFKERCLQDAGFREAYEALRPEFELIKEFIKARKKAKLSQIELAKRLKSQQPAIARLEKGGYANASITSLNKVANALGYSLHVSLRANKKLV